MSNVADEAERFQIFTSVSVLSNFPPLILPLFHPCILIGALPQYPQYLPLSEEFKSYKKQHKTPYSIHLCFVFVNENQCNFFPQKSDSIFFN